MGTTEWTKHSAKMADAGKKNAQIKRAIENLEMTDDYESRKLELQQQLIDIPKTIGFCKPVITKITQPDVHSQLVLNEKFGVAAPVQTPRGSVMPRLWMAVGAAIVLVQLVY